MMPCPNKNTFCWEIIALYNKSRQSRGLLVDKQHTKERRPRRMSGILYLEFTWVEVRGKGIVEIRGVIIEDDSDNGMILAPTPGLIIL